MVLQGQDKWRKHPMIFETWRRPFPMLGTACVVFAIICIGEAMYKSTQKHAPSAPVYRFIKNPENPSGPPLMQKRVKVHHHGHGHGHALHATAHSSSGATEEEDDEDVDAVDEDGEPLSAEDKLRRQYDLSRMHKVQQAEKEADEDFNLAAYVDNSQKEEA